MHAAFQSVVFCCSDVQLSDLPVNYSLLMGRTYGDMSNLGSCALHLPVLPRKRHCNKVVKCICSHSSPQRGLGLAPQLPRKLQWKHRFANIQTSVVAQCATLESYLSATDGLLPRPRRQRSELMITLLCPAPLQISRRGGGAACTPVTSRHKGAAPQTDNLPQSARSVHPPSCPWHFLPSGLAESPPSKKIPTLTSQLRQ